jgi:tetratricopeptide (TPR) repeat protein
MVHKTPRQLVDEGTAHFSAGRLSKAEKCYRLVLKKNPDDPVILRALGMTLRGQGQTRGAITTFKRALKNDPTNAALHGEIGLCLGAQGDLAGALEAFETGIAVNPIDPRLHFFLGQYLLATGNAATAVTSLGCAADLDPGDQRTRELLCDAATASGILPVPLHHAQWLIDHAPEHASSHARLGTVHRINAQLDDALAAYDTALAIDPSHVEGIAGRAEVLESLHRTDEARQLLDPIVTSGTVPYPIARAYMRICRQQDRPADAVGILKKLIDSRTLTPWLEANLNILLGQALEGMGEYDRAFRAYQSGNAIHRGEWDCAAHEGLVDAMISTFPVGYDHHGSCTSRRPVFIVGMFRSGTTLLETILARHPSITAGGEIDEILRIAAKIGAEERYPNDVPVMPTRTTDAFSDQYLGVIQSRFSDTDHVIDKLPTNYLHVGLITTLFPHATIIHTTRDPMDTCLSCFANAFTRRHAYTSDLSDLGATYRQYERLMAHWNDVLGDRIHTVAYEELITTPEPVIRGALDAIGVPWDDSCLHHRKDDRIAMTPSVDQVRKGLYTTSIGRAAKFGAAVEPLKTSLAGQ